MAMSAADVLESAQVFDSVEKAVLDAHLVIGTTRRWGPRRGVFLSMEDAVKKIERVRKHRRVAIMFGRESKGLDNASLNFCDWVTTIPVQPDCPSINLAQAVMIMAYSLCDRHVTLPSEPPRRGTFKPEKALERMEQVPVYVPKNEIGVVLDRFEEAIRSLGYGAEANKANRIRGTLQRMIKRNGLLESEAQMLKGISRRICEKMQQMSG